MEFSTDRLNRAVKEAKIKERQGWLDRLFCEHLYKQVHPKPIPDDWPKGKPVPTHGQRVDEGTGRCVASFECVRCGKEKSIRIEALDYLIPHRPHKPPSKSPPWPLLKEK